MINQPIRVPVVSIKPGDTVDFPTYTFYDSDNQPIDMSSWTFSASWKKNQSAEGGVTFAVNSSRANIGIIEIQISSTNSARIKTDGFWTLKAVHVVSGTVKTILTGSTRVFRD